MVMANTERVAKALEAGGPSMPVSAALAIINDVLGEVLDGEEAELDAATATGPASLPISCTRQPTIVAGPQRPVPQRPHHRLAQPAHRCGHRRSRGFGSLPGESAVAPDYLPWSPAVAINRAYRT